MTIAMMVILASAAGMSQLLMKAFLSLLEAGLHAAPHPAQRKLVL